MSENAVSPISDVTKLDLLVERNDGGIEMCIVAQSPVDGTPETLRLLEEKIRNYVREALDTSFRERFGGIEVQKVELFFVSQFDVDPAILSLVSRLASEVERMGLTLKIRRY